MKAALRDLSNQLALYNHQVGAQVKLKGVDFDALELLKREGPMSPKVLSQRTGLHPATMTGVLDRLQRDGWIVRERPADAADRRAVTVRALKERNAELIGHLAGMNSQMDELCAGYTDAELELIADFLRRTTQAGHRAAGLLRGDDQP